MRLDKVCFGVAGLLSRCVENFTDVLLFFEGFSCCGDPEAVPCAQFGKVHFDIIRRDVTCWEVLPELDNEEVREERTNDGV